jgi:hypothetical protein
VHSNNTTDRITSQNHWAAITNKERSGSKLQPELSKGIEKWANVIHQDLNV